MAPIPAGDWHLVGDGVCTNPVDIKYEILWRKAMGGDTVLATYDHHFDPNGMGNFDAIPYEATVAGPAADAHSGDQIVLRISTSGTTATTAWAPNGDGANSNGRIPFFDLPR